ncbi:hypothetical protein [Micrococcus luteus]|uniref:hypothetical protein n=1 Tax=Micrococcus luteus TaxID=1270 RepID=UPI0020CEF189|nr:hypothetical protein [Micrococcus luteus]UTT45156.1 hypothetical protein NMQ02_08515 [Micrococcus luteus]
MPELHDATAGDRFARLGFGPRFTDPVTPPEWWKTIALTGYDLVKAARACAGVERFARAAGMRESEVAVMRSFCLLLESALYAWDEQVEEDQAAGRGPRPSSSPDVMRRLLAEIDCDTAAALADIEDLRDLFATESLALTAPPSASTWEEIIRLRSSDLRLQLRVVLLCAGHEEHTADAVVDALSPALAALDIVDDVRSVREDGRSGGYNSYLYLCRFMSGADARARLEEVGARLDRLTLERLAALDGPAFACALAIAVGAGGPRSARVVGLAAHAPRRAVVSLFGAAAMGEGRDTAGVLRRLWTSLEKDAEDDADAESSGPL